MARAQHRNPLVVPVFQPIIAVILDAIWVEISSQGRIDVSRVPAEYVLGVCVVIEAMERP
jgi:hypothetical protein